MEGLDHLAGGLIQGPLPVVTVGMQVAIAMIRPGFPGVSPLWAHPGRAPARRVLPMSDDGGHALGAMDRRHRGDKGP